MNDSPTEASDAIEIAAKVVEKSSTVDKDVIELSNGIKLRIRAVAVMTLRHAIAALRKPEPPMVDSPDKGRMEPWEGDPHYLEELGRWEYQMGETTLNVMLSLGTKLEYVPKGVDKPEDVGWVELLEAADVPVKLNSQPARYLSWLRFYALTEPADIAKVSEAVARRSGVIEADVSDSLNSFRGGENGRTDTDPEAPQLSVNGDNVPTPISGPSTGSRRKG